MDKRRKRKKQFIRLTVMLLIVMVSLTYSITFAGEEVTRYTGKSYTQNVQYDDYVIAHGIDVSTYQSNMDWAKVKAAGIDFAIIRIGGRGYGSGKLYSDDKFLDHMQGAKKYNFLTGIYFFSQCISENEAIEEADYTIQLLTDAGYTVEDLDLPIFMDYEINSSDYRIKNMTKAKRTKCVKAFLNRLTELGYKGGIYTNVTFANNSLENASELADNYTYWVANYNSYCSSSFNTYEIWQYSSSGVVNGSSKRSDVNFMYLDLNPKATVTNDEVITTYDELGLEHTEVIPKKKSLVNANVSVNAPTYTYYEGKAYEPSVTVSLDGSTLTQGIDYKVKYIHNTQAGTAYAYIIGIGDCVDYKLSPFTIEKSNAVSTLSIAEIADRTYTGTVTKPSDITIKDTNGNTLVKGLDYTFVGSNAKNAGTAGLKITFLENYSGTRNVSYNIVKAEQKLTLENTPDNITIDQPDFNIGAKSNFSEAKLTYTSSDKEIATVSDDGTVHVTGHGTVTITVTSPESSNLKAASKSFSMIVKAPPQNVTTSYTRYKKNQNSGSFNLNAKTNGDGELTYEVEVVESKANSTNSGSSVESVLEEAQSSETAQSENNREAAAVIVENQESATATDMISDTGYEVSVAPSSESMQAETSSSDTGSVVRVTKSGRVIIEGTGTAIIHVRASETKYFEAGEKLVTVVVAAVDDESKVLTDEAITNTVKGTTITSFSASSSKGATTLTWKKSKAKYGVDFYQIWRSEKKSSGYKKIYETTNGTKYTYTNTDNLISGKTYYYKVRGVRYVNGEAVYTPYFKISSKAK